jgi:hypothetical protein
MYQRCNQLLKKPGYLIVEEINVEVEEREKTEIQKEGECGNPPNDGK